MKHSPVFVVLLLLTVSMTPVLDTVASAEGSYAPLQAGTISGTVLDGSGNPMAGAIVSFNGANATVTDVNGEFSAMLAHGDYQVLGSASGYEPFVVNNVSTDSSITAHMIPGGWYEAGDMFSDGTFSGVEMIQDGMRLSVTDSPLLPQDEWFFVTANDYEWGGNWNQRNSNRGYVWYVDINGDGTFANKDDYYEYDDWEVAVDSFSLNVRGVPLADFDNDGDYDMVVPFIKYDGNWKDNNNLYFVENLGVDGEGHRTFADPAEIQGTAFDVNAYLMDCAVDDYDLDGNWDFAITGNDDALYFYEGIGNGSFIKNTITTNAPGGRGRGKDAGDVNNDGNPDVVYTEYGTGTVWAFLGTGNGTFSEPVYLFTAYSQLYDEAAYRDPYGLVVADLDNDGTADIMTNDGSPGVYSIWKGDGACGFTWQGVSFDYSSHGAIDDFDFDGDGDLDIIAIEHGSGGRIYSAANMGDGTSWSSRQVIKYDTATHRQNYAISAPPSLTQSTLGTTGYYVSDIHDAGSVDDQVTLVTYSAHVNANQTLTVQLRSSDDPGMAGASAWEDVDPLDNTLTTPSGRYIQYRVFFNGTGRSTPVLESIAIRFFEDPVWLAGQVTNTGGYPVPDVTVSLMSGGLLQNLDITDADGMYRIGVPAGSYRLTTGNDIYNGYQESIALIGNATLDLEITRINHIDLTSVDDFSPGTFNGTIVSEKRNAVVLDNNLALDATVFSNYGDWSTYPFHQAVDGRRERIFHGTRNINSGDNMNPQWIAIDLGSQQDITHIEYLMNNHHRLWQSGFKMAVYTDYNVTTDTFSGETMIVSYDKGTWTDVHDCPDTFLLTDGAEFTGTSGSTVSGWLPSTATVTGRYVRLFDVYGNHSTNDRWHYYQVADIGVYGTGMTGEYISPEYNTTDPDFMVSAIQWHEDLPPGTTITTYFRSGNTTAEVNASAWVPVDNLEYDFGTALQGELVQYRVVLTTADGYETPVLRDMSFFFYEQPAWVHGEVTQADVGTRIPMAKVHVTQDVLQMENLTVLSQTDGTYVAPVRYTTSGDVEYTITIEKQGYELWTGSALISNVSTDRTRHAQLVPTDDWTYKRGNKQSTSYTTLASDIVGPGVSWKYHIGGYATWGVTADVNLDSRNDIVMIYGDRVVAKTPDDVLLWIGKTSAVDSIIGVYDVDKNGVPDVIAGNYYPARISIINGINGTLQYEKTWPTRYLQYNSPDNIIVDDFDGLNDGKYEMIVKINDGRLRAWKFNTVGWRAVPETMWDISYAYDSYNSLAIGDVDLDGEKEVVDLARYRVAVYNAEDGSFEYERTLSSDPYRVSGSVVIVDLDPADGRGNIVIPYRRNEFSGIFVLECNETTIGERSHYEVPDTWGDRYDFHWRVGSVADLDGDGVYEMAVSLRYQSEEARATGHHRWHSLVIDLDTGAVEAQFGAPGSWDWEVRAVVDIDDDPLKEILIQDGSRWVCIDGSLSGYTEKWNSTSFQRAYMNRYYQTTHDPTACWYRAGSSNAYGDVDGDGINELFLSTSYEHNIGAYNVDGSSPEEIWFFPTRSGNPTPNVFVRDVANLTGDDLNEAVVVSDDGHVWTINGTGDHVTARTGGPTTHLWVSDLDDDGPKDVLFHMPRTGYLGILNITGADYHNEPVMSDDGVLTGPRYGDHILVDYDNDGRTELVTRSYSAILVYEWNGTEWWREWRFNRHSIFGGAEKLTTFRRMVVGDFNGDDHLDIFFTYRNYSYSPPHLWTIYVTGSMVLDGATQTPIWVKDRFYTHRDLTAHDVDGDGMDELVVMDGTTYRVMDPLTGVWVLEVPVSPVYSYAGQMVGSGDLDIMDEVLVGYQYYSTTVIGSALDMETGEVLWYGGDPMEDSYRMEPGYGAAADVDRDGVDEVIQTMIDGRVYCIDDDGSVLWKFDLDNDEIELSAPSVADMNQDGTPDILFGASDGYMYVLHGNNGTIAWSFYFGFSMQQPVVADMDNDGMGEVVVSVSDGYVYCLDNIDTPELTLREQDVESVVNQPDGTYVTIGVDVRNEGGVKVDNATVRFTDNGVVFHEEGVKIRPGQKVHLDVTWFANPVGNHTINISVDPENAIVELNETNNHFIRTIYVWPVPDMAIANMTKWDRNPDVEFGVGPVLGYENRIEVTIHNLGPVIAENFNINLTDNNRTVDSVMVTLGAYENGTYSLYWTPIDDGQNFTHTLEIWIDKESRIVEFTKDNNHAILKAVVFGPPPEIELRREDITLSGTVDMPDERIGVIEGDYLTLDCTLRNTGFLVAAHVGVLVFLDLDRDRAFDVREDLFISLDPQYTVHDRWSEVIEIIPSGYHNETIEQGMVLTIDTAPLRVLLAQKTGSDSLDAYPLCIIMDPRDIIPEVNNNNYVKVGNLLVIPAKAELSITEEGIVPDFIEKQLVNEDMTVWVKVQNHGNTEANGVTVTLTDNGEEVGNRTVNIPAVTTGTGFDAAYQILTFRFAPSTSGEHVIRAQLVYGGEEALSIQDNNAAQVPIQVSDQPPTSSNGMASAPIAMSGAAFVVAAMVWFRKREED